MVQDYDNDKSLITVNSEENMDEINPQFDDSLFTPETFIRHAEELSIKSVESDEKKGLFMVKNASRWLDQAKQRPIPKELFGVLWYEGELCILFSDTNLGKSILAVQIGNSISRGEQIPGFVLQAAKQQILYFDFELSDKQFEARYSENFNRHYIFDDNFLRAEINPEESDYKEHNFETFEEYLNHSIEKVIIETDAKILIIDNITYLNNETEKAKFALPLMKHMQSLKKKYGLSILCLAHTPKRDLSKPITRNDLQGSKMLMNFCDSSFSIGESSNDKSIRYLKQIKARNTEMVFDTENVCTCQITKPDNFLMFEFMGFGIEREHLKQHSEKDKQGLIDQVKELSQQGLSQRVISTQLGISLGAVNKYLKKRT